MTEKQILIIDDEIEIRQFMQDFFEDAGYNVQIAGDGLEGVEKFARSDFGLVLS